MKVLYFSHDSNAMGDNKIDDLRADYGMEGYGVYWGVVEAMSREPDLKLPYTKRKANALRLAMSPTFDMKKFIDDCIDEYKLFETDGEYFWSKSLKKRLAYANEISEKRREAANARWHPEVKNDQQLPDPENMDKVMDDIDPGWKKVIDEYQRQIGMLPFGDSMDTLMSYYDEMGSGAMIIAIRETNLAQPEKPYWYLKAILESFSKAGVHSEEAAEASVREFNRKRQSWNGQNTKQEQPDEKPEEEVKWLC